MTQLALHVYACTMCDCISASCISVLLLGPANWGPELRCPWNDLGPAQQDTEHLQCGIESTAGNPTAVPNVVAFDVVWHQAASELVV